MSSTAHTLAESATTSARKREFVNHRRVVICAVQAVLLAIAYWLSFELRFDFVPPKDMAIIAMKSMPLVVAVQLAGFYAFGLLAGWWRYAGTSDFWDLAKATIACGVVLWPIVLRLYGDAGYPRSVLLTDLALSVLITGAARISVRTYTDAAQRYAVRKNTLVVGAGQAGNNVVRDLKRNPALGLKPVGFVDDDPSKKGLRIQGVRVLGSTECLPQIIIEYDVTCVLIAIPSADGTQIEHIIHQCRQCHVDFRILPPIHERIRGFAVAEQVRSLKVEDLLGRAPVHLDLASIRAKVQDRTLLVTGAGGSIGSELARQIARFNPKRLVLFERAESDLFRIAMELQATFPDIPCRAVIGDILDVGCLRDVFAQYRPDSVFHAAAYKHVPMMEQHCFQAVTNNVLGTYNVALIARQFGADDFVLISSDKAVRPSNIMGVTKRVAELIVLGLQKQTTRFIAVRFGNVLGSNGSVLPIFQQQIANGGPVTVTHPDATRYFMTIPEAVQLVLQASAMGKGGEIFILDMGQPIRILDMAKNLIRLSAKTRGRDAEIVFTGLRPGEKLHEDLTLAGTGAQPTVNEKIHVVEDGALQFDVVRRWIDELAEIVETKNTRALMQKLKEIVPEYTPSREILAASGAECHDVLHRYKQARATLDVLQAA